MSERFFHLMRTSRSLSIMSIRTRQSSCEMLRRRQSGIPQQPPRNAILLNSGYTQADTTSSAHNHPHPQPPPTCRAPEHLLHPTSASRPSSAMSPHTKQFSCETLRKHQPGIPQQPPQNTISLNSNHILSLVMVGGVLPVSFGSVENAQYSHASVAVVSVLFVRA